MANILAGMFTESVISSPVSLVVTQRNKEASWRKVNIQINLMMTWERLDLFLPFKKGWVIFIFGSVYAVLVRKIICKYKKMSTWAFSLLFAMYVFITYKLVWTSFLTNIEFRFCFSSRYRWQYINLYILTNTFLEETIQIYHLMFPLECV